MAPKIANIHLLDVKRNVQSGFCLCNDGLLDGLLLGVFPTTILFSLGMDEGPQAVAEQAD